MKAGCHTFPILMSSRARSRSPARLALRAATLYSLCRANNRACGSRSASGRGAMAELPGRLVSGWKRLPTQNKRPLENLARVLPSPPHVLLVFGNKNRISSDTWLHGTGSWCFFLRVSAGCFLVGWRPFAQGYGRWNLILTDLPTFPHSGKLGLQSLKERIRLGMQVATWALLEDRPGTHHVYHTCEWPSLYCHLTHSPALPVCLTDNPTHLQASFTTPGFGSFTSLLGTSCSLPVVMDPFLQQSLQPPRPSSLQILQLRAGPLRSQLGPCHSLPVRKLPQKTDLWDSRRKKYLNPQSLRQSPQERPDTNSGKQSSPLPPHQ